MSRTAARTDDTTSKVPSRIARALQYQGIFARVARHLQLGKSGRSHVYRVAIGQRQSRRVMNALLQEIKRIEQAEKAA
jgi:hypothetical protein